MNKRTIMATLAVAAVLGTASAADTLPQVSGVTMTQTPFTRQVQITYDLADADAIITLSIETNGVAIPDSAVTRLTGDVCKKVTIGTGRTITWNAGADWPEHVTESAKARVTAWSTNAPPQVMVIDLREGANADNYPVNYYVSTAALPYGGVTNSVYKNSRLVMRKINNGTFTMGEGAAAKEVTLSQDFYAGVFQVTQGQWHKIIGADPSKFYGTFNPVEMVSYHDIRENPDTNTPLDTNWPQSDEVGADSFMGKLRNKTGLTTFDLPTDAQWEYACRAGTTSYFNDGFTTGADTNVLNELGWYNGNAAGTTHAVGEKTPNVWGLYDMHGNVYEWCLDWYASSLSGESDPEGAVSGSDRVIRGGCWGYTASHCRSAIRNGSAPLDRNHAIGFRLVRTLP